MDQVSVEMNSVCGPLSRPFRQRLSSWLSNYSDCILLLGLGIDRNYMAGSLCYRRQGRRGLLLEASRPWSVAGGKEAVVCYQRQGGRGLLPEARRPWSVTRGKAAMVCYQRQGGRGLLPDARRPWSVTEGKAAVVCYQRQGGRGEARRPWSVTMICAQRHGGQFLSPWLHYCLLLHTNWTFSCGSFASSGLRADPVKNCPCRELCQSDHADSVKTPRGVEIGKEDGTVPLRES